MLDIRKIKENPEAVKAGLRAKEVDCDAIVDRILEMDVQIRGLKTATETKTAEKNKIAKENGKLFGMKKGAEKKGESTAEIDEQIAKNNAESSALNADIEAETAKLGELCCKNKADVSRMVAILEKKGLISLDYDKPLRNVDLTRYGAYPVKGSFALTQRGQTVVEMLEISGIA